MPSDVLHFWSNVSQFWLVYRKIQHYKSRPQLYLARQAWKLLSLLLSHFLLNLLKDIYLNGVILLYLCPDPWCLNVWLTHSVVLHCTWLLRLLRTKNMMQIQVRPHKSWLNKAFKVMWNMKSVIICFYIILQFFSLFA